jgi:hypothetical protein
VSDSLGNTPSHLGSLGFPWRLGCPGKLSRGLRMRGVMWALWALELLAGHLHCTPYTVLLTDAQPPTSYLWKHLHSWIYRDPFIPRLTRLSVLLPAERIS